MPRPSFFQITVLSWRFLFLTTFLGAFFAFLFSLSSPLEYASSVRVLITQPSATGFDPYTAIKSTERIATSLSELVYASTFFDNVMQQGKGFNPSYFPTNEYDKRKMWRKAIQIGIAPGTGIMTIQAFHSSREQARILVDGVARELALQTPNYFGSSVRVQVIDAPLDSRWIARPNFGLNAVFGAFVGLLLGLGWVLWRGPMYSRKAALDI